MKTTFSIIIPFKNANKTLSKAVESVVAQSMDDYHLFLIDDHSVDNSTVIAQSYSDKFEQITYLLSDGMGVSAARNFGLKQVTSDYVCFVDADDFVATNYLSTFLDILNENPQLAITNVTVTSKILNTETEKQVMNREETLKALFRNDLFEGYSVNKAFKVSVIHDNDIRFNENIQYSEDLLFCFEYIQHIEKAIFKNIDTYFYVLDNSSTMEKSKLGYEFSENELSGIKVLSMIERKNDIKQLDKIIKTRLVWANSLISRKLSFNNSNGELSQYQAKIRKQCRQFVTRNLLLFLATSYYGLKDKLLVTIDIVCPTLLVKMWKLKND